MKRTPSPLRLLLALSLTALAAAGCLGTSKPVEFYTLSPLPQAAERTGPTPGTLVAVLPVAIPSMIERPQIVSRTDDNRIAVSDFHHWAGSLGDSFTRVLIVNLNALLAAKRVNVLPDAYASDPAFRLSVTVSQFDGRLADTVWLNAVWTIKNSKTQKTLAVGTSRIQEQVGGGGHGDLVAAESRAIAALSREIAAELGKLD
jgi:uncharacterized lipoprotein YmbA